MLLNISLEHIPAWKADSSLSSQEIPLILWSEKVHYRSHKTQPLVPILRQNIPVHVYPPHLLKNF